MRWLGEIFNEPLLKFFIAFEKTNLENVGPKIFALPTEIRALE